jgi:SnoaL-like domain
MAPATPDLLELRRLVDAYAVAVDDRDPDALSALFAEGGALLVYEAGSDELQHAYRNGELAQLTTDLERAYARTFHLVGNAVVDVDGDRATGTVYCLASHIRDGSRGATIATMPVRYRDRYVRTGDGWRFHERVATVLWRERGPAQWPPRDSDGSGRSMEGATP